MDWVTTTYQHLVVCHRSEEVLAVCLCVELQMQGRSILGAYNLQIKQTRLMVSSGAFVYLAFCIVLTQEDKTPNSHAEYKRHGTSKDLISIGSSKGPTF